MKVSLKNWLIPLLFTLGGALVGLAYYYFVGCATGSYAITSNPLMDIPLIGFIKQSYPPEEIRADYYFPCQSLSDMV